MALLKCNILALPLVFNIGVIDLHVLEHFFDIGFRDDIQFAHYNPRFVGYKRALGQTEQPETTNGWKPSYFPENQRLVTFCVISWEIAKSKWFYDFQGMLKEGRRPNQRFFRIYKIILEKSETELPPADYGVNERQALVLDAVYSYFKNSDAEGAACRRVIELMNRIMGADLPGNDFPDYHIRDQARIAWHTNREDFNWGPDNPRKDAIRKYKIIDGRPDFQIGRLP